jgi:trehalose 6-phosphate synthase/phosphatase
VPTRDTVPCYQQFRREIDELVGRINGEHGMVDWTPIRYLHQFVSREQLVALYLAADVMLVTPLRDGMNLVAKEFVASRIDGDGVLVLSEFAGAARQLPEAIHVNPYAIDDTARAMSAALGMGETERRARMRHLRSRIAAADLHGWRSRFLEDLASVAPCHSDGDERPTWSHRGQDPPTGFGEPPRCAASHALAVCDLTPEA